MPSYRHHFRYRKAALKVKGNKGFKAAFKRLSEAVDLSKRFSSR